MAEAGAVTDVEVLAALEFEPTELCGSRATGTGYCTNEAVAVHVHVTCGFAKPYCEAHVTWWSTMRGVLFICAGCWRQDVEHDEFRIEPRGGRRG